MSDATTQTHDRRDGIQVVARVADILRHLSMVPDGLTPQELADRSGIPRPTIYRIAKALAAEDFVRIMPSGRLAVGPGIMGVAISSRRDIRHEVSPFLQKLSEDLDETADLAVLYAGEALYVDQYVSPHVLRIVAHIGGRLPLHCTANGKALLASLTPEQVDAVLPEPLTRNTPHTITDKRLLAEEIQHVRDTGLSFDLEEYEEGVVAVGAFVRDVMGDVVSLAAVVPMLRYKRDEAAIVAAVARTRDEAQAALVKPAQPR
ncbi:MAG TPA: IclR family transcriptional regulator [Thermoleophilia bacterium]|nr:IclR family transcriptional regulator [Thermoleophilia bacterium]